MNLSSISQQLVRDLKASAAKTAVLGLLLLVGLFFWVPPLLKAFSSSTPTTPKPSVETGRTSSGSTSAPTSGSPTSSEPAKNSHNSQTLLKLIHEQPLLQPASVEEMPLNPFAPVDDLLPLPVLITEDAIADSQQPVQAGAKLIEKLDGLVLKSTLVGPTRRVAIINSQLFREGQTVPWNDKQLRLESVNRKSVTLTDGSQSWQLTLKDSNDESSE